MRPRSGRVSLAVLLSVVLTMSAVSPTASAVRGAGADVDVLYVERTPRIPFDPNDFQYTSGLPAAGDAVVFQGHVKNWGTRALTVAYRWRFDNQDAGGGQVRIRGGAEVTVPFRWSWAPADHTVELIVDPDNRIAELSELNNAVAVRTNAMLLGLWIEQSMYDWFHRRQLDLHDGANGFEDYLQRMARRWNELFGRARFPATPDGVLDRVAVDEVVVVPDGALPLHGGAVAGNNPDPLDLTVDMQWGIPWSPEAIAEPEGEYRFGWRLPFFLSPPLIHEMNHARFLPDLYPFDRAEPDPAQPQRILLTDDQGQLVVGTSLMPFIAFTGVYYNKWRDIMGAGSFMYDAHAARVWNWKAHKRGVGNENAPADFWVYFNDLPERNHIRFVDQAGRPIAGAQVELYQGPGQVYDNEPDLTATTDADGYLHLPRDPFGAAIPDFGTVILKLRYRNELYFLFQELTDFNLAFWRGQQQDAYYVREIDLRDEPLSVPDGAWLASYFDGARCAGSQIQPTVAADPPPGVPANAFSVYYQGGVSFTEGWKRFTITVDGGVQLYLNGRLVFDQWDNHGPATWTPVIYTLADAPVITPGHGQPNGPVSRVEVRYRHDSGPAQVGFSWTDLETPADIPVNAWRGDYYSTPDLHGYATSRTETVIDNDYGDHSADPALFFSDNWSARWLGDWSFPRGTTEFTVTADGGVRVLIDGQVALDQWGDHPLAVYRFVRDLNKGGTGSRSSMWIRAGTPRSGLAGGPDE
jgi:hypothetical protein